MEIPNLSSTTSVNKPLSFSLPLFLIICVLAIGLGFASSRLKSSSPLSPVTSTTTDSQQPLSADSITDKDSIKAGQIFGDTAKVFNDTATGLIEKGSINGEGTHILNREGGLSQRASLTSSVIDLDLFVGRKVEIKGATNTSNKTSWLLDVGWVKVLE